MAARYLFTNSYELATGNWQPDANSIVDGLRRLKLNRQQANGSQVLIHLLLLIGNWQPDTNSILDGLRRLKLNRQPANGSQVLIH